MLDRNELQQRAKVILSMMNELAKEASVGTEEQEERLRRYQALEATWRDLMQKLDEGQDEGAGASELA
jgi:hypothetical protein